MPLKKTPVLYLKSLKPCTVSDPLITVELSMHPLDANYLLRIDDFLDRLHRYPDFKIEVGTSSTQVFGPASAVFAALQTEILHAFKSGQCPFVLKVLKGDLSQMPLKDYSAH